MSFPESQRHTNQLEAGPAGSQREKGARPVLQGAVAGRALGSESRGTEANAPPAIASQPQALADSHFATKPFSAAGGLSPLPAVGRLRPLVPENRAVWLPLAATPCGLCVEVWPILDPAGRVRVLGWILGGCKEAIVPVLRS